MSKTVRKRAEIEDCKGRVIREGDMVLVNKGFAIGKRRFVPRLDWDWDQIIGKVAFNRGCFSLIDTEYSPSCGQTAFLDGEKISFRELIEEFEEEGEDFEFYILKKKKNHSSIKEQVK